MGAGGHWYNQGCSGGPGAAPGSLAEETPSCPLKPSPPNFLNFSSYADILMEPKVKSRGFKGPHRFLIHLYLLKIQTQAFNCDARHAGGNLLRFRCRCANNPKIWLKLTLLFRPRCTLHNFYNAPHFFSFILQWTLHRGGGVDCIGQCTAQPDCGSGEATSIYGPGCGV